MAIGIRRRRQSFLRWSGSKDSGSLDRPNFVELETASGEEAMVASIEGLLNRILGGHEALPEVTPGDFRKALKGPIEKNGARLQWVAQRVVTPAVIREAVQIALGRAPYRFFGRTSILASLLAATIVTATPFVERHRKGLTPPDSAPKDPNTRHSKKRSKR